MRERSLEPVDGCALQATLRGDPMLGTAFPAARVLLVEQPGPWGREGLRQSQFDRDVALVLEARAQALGLRVLAIRRPGRTPRGIDRTWGLADCRPGRESLYWGSFKRDVELLDLALSDPADPAGFADVTAMADRDARAAYLICAHSKHDQCCALRGRPVAAAMHEQRPGQAWECSHVGGERFAANVLVLPYGLLYGRVPVLAVAEIAQATERGEVIGARLRGRVGLPPVAQAALAYAYDQLGLRAVDALRVERTGAPVHGVAEVDLAGPAGRLRVRVQIEPVDAPGLSCAKPGPNVYLSYRPMSVLAAD